MRLGFIFLLIMSVAGCFSQDTIVPMAVMDVDGQAAAVNEAIRENYPQGTDFKLTRPDFEFFIGRNIAEFPKIAEVWYPIPTANAKQRLDYPDLNIRGWRRRALEHSIQNPDQELYFAYTHRGKLTGNDAFQDYLVFCVSDGVVRKYIRVSATDY